MTRVAEGRSSDSFKSYYTCLLLSNCAQRVSSSFVHSPFFTPTTNSSSIIIDRTFRDFEFSEDGCPTVHRTSCNEIRQIHVRSIVTTDSINLYFNLKKYSSLLCRKKFSSDETRNSIPHHNSMDRQTTFLLGQQ